jgi:hypothetical protein
MNSSEKTQGKTMQSWQQFTLCSTCRFTGSLLI